MTAAMRNWCKLFGGTLLAVGLLSAANVRLYLKDGSHHLVREYQVVEDRVRFYSLERGEWEEAPLELFDLDRTRAEQKRLEEQRRQRAEEDKVDRQAEREGRTELHKVPLDDGVYWVNDEQVTPLKQGEPKTKGNKRRSVLKAMAPVPIVTGKATVELEGPRSAFVIHTPAPQFYIRLDKVERFGVIRLTPKKGSRIVEDLTIIPISKDVIEEQKEVEVFRQQLAPGVYKIWPVEPLEPGEYAVVQFTKDKMNLQVWDFAYRKP
ncbi:MAG: hypothetical protein HY236_15115 [Acidobacteria bacterium]|nr:hypothetical protein [Acidobacteriota bacterium]